ncbi:MAG: ribonuclease III [Actinomycetales bacterium]
MGVHEEAGPVSPSATPDPAPLLEALGVEVSLEVLERALTHSSYAYEQGGLDNERFEFLGDAVLGQAITHSLYLRFPDLPEGELAKRRASIVSTSALAEVAESINLGVHLRLGRGEELTGGREKPSLLADALEALIAAVFLDQGPVAATACVERLMGGLVDDADARSEVSDPKTALQEWAAKHQSGVPQYTITHSGPDHAKIFVAQVFLDSPSPERTPVGEGSGSSKKAAELVAASVALKSLRA